MSVLNALGDQLDQHLAQAAIVLTVGAVAVVGLTRYRLGGRDPHTKQLKASPVLLGMHTGFGAVGLLLWVVFLWTGREAWMGGDAKAVGDPEIGIFALAFLWVTAMIGLMLLVRWVPGRGKRAATAVRERWTDGPILSLLAHLGMLAGVLVLTWAYLVAAV